MTFKVLRKNTSGISRRRFLSTAAATGAGALSTIAMPYLSRAADRPTVTHGVQSGDVGADGGVVWARADRPSQMMVEVATTESFGNTRALPPVAALPESDFTAKMLLENLPSGQTRRTKRAPKPLRRATGRRAAASLKSPICCVSSGHRASPTPYG